MVLEDVSMISLALAKKLKEAGLVWHTTVHDFFAIPDRDMDNRVFVLSDMMVTMGLLRGWPAVVFHGTAEWAMWLPTESQLREQLEAELVVRHGRFHQLARNDEGYICDVSLNEERVTYTAVSPSEAYGLALLNLLQSPLPSEV